MNFNLLEDDKVPLAISEDILRYLQDVDANHEGEEGIYDGKFTNFTENQIREILEELLQKFEKRQRIKEVYEARASCHNQKDLIDLKTIFEDFNIDEEMYEALTFRETLVISKIFNGETIPVGGLCLDVQKALGKQTTERNHCDDIEIRLQRIFKKEHKQTVVCDETRDLKSTEINVETNSDSCNLEDGLEKQSERNLSKFLIHVRSQFDVNGANAGSCITSWVDRKFHTLEELRKEFCVEKNNDCNKNNDYNKNNDDKNKDDKNNDDKNKDYKNKDDKNKDYQNKDDKNNDDKNKDDKNKDYKNKDDKNNDDKNKDDKNKDYKNNVDKNNDDKNKNSTNNKENKNNEKDLYVGMVKNYYYIKHTSKIENFDDRKFYSFCKTSKFISEGANFVLLRYLAITKYIGTFELSAMYINGDMCRNIYECTGPESEIINDTKLDICKINRTIIEECGIEHKCYTVLTLQGQLIHQKWEGTEYILQINPFAKVSNEKPTGNEQVLLKHTWEGDMQLFSHYLDEKVKAEMRIKSYMLDHPEFKGIIIDYINAILLLKPEDILEFTMSHFMSFAPTHMPKNDYFD